MQSVNLDVLLAAWSYMSACKVVQQCCFDQSPAESCFNTCRVMLVLSCTSSHWVCWRPTGARA